MSELGLYIFSGGLSCYIEVLVLIVSHSDAHHPPPAPSETEDLRTLDSYAKKPKASLSTTTEAASIPITDGAEAPITAGGPADLEAEADQQGAFNPETGEINWDCPCLGGMANGPCGEEFKAAFSCFVYSNEEPKGVDCIEKFKGMQDCFRAHPDVYGAELEDDEYEAGAAAEGEGQGESLTAIAKDAATEIDGKVKAAVDEVKTDAAAASERVSETVDQVKVDAAGAKDRAKAAAQEVKEKHIETSKSEEAVPEPWHDATNAPIPSQEKKSEAKSN